MPELPAFLDDLPLARQAARCAFAAHAGQRRDSDAAPFVLHPLEVASLLANRGFGDEVVAAGLLHDLVEDTDVTLEELRRDFGPTVAGYVDVLTEDASITEFEPRKAALRAALAAAPPQAQAIYAADKIVKARELRATLASFDGASRQVVLRRIAHYTASLETLEASCAPEPLIAQLRFELWALKHLPPGGGFSAGR